MPSSRSTAPICWRQVWGLSAVLTAVMISWLAYGLYQPQILQHLGFVKLAAWLEILQGGLGALIEPGVGGLSDRMQQRFGSRLPLITTGVTLAGLIFVAVALLLQGQIPTGIRWSIPVLMTIWVASMILFRGPVIALLRQAAPLEALPEANVALTVVFGLIGALAPVLTMFLQSVGASLTFLLGAIALVVAATLLYKTMPPGDLFPAAGEGRSPLVPLQMGCILGIGWGAGFLSNLLLRTFPPLLQPALGVTPPWITSMILLVSAVAAMPAGRVIERFGGALTMLGGLALALACLGGAALAPSPVIACSMVLLAGGAFGLVFESQIPLALGMLPRDRAGLATGLLFGGLGGSTALLSALQQSGETFTTLMAIPGAIAALALVALCLTVHQRRGSAIHD
ncbi:hypothetical protein DO97_02040 [Neosynechococcus sphagnicola sy1]|uniref:MFS transporter n=1 Tax=Neosynechococcus sphagnicola sy1 TaxID=1497020 RepID=A0A098TLE9_9CYAN|nr:MFS transporter [Neosynechococcus sphagnicola]KGF73134.1 hypothetical protein DO97_02040 [Neosynechococcus sphagnicola sy1]